jgi:hypothetical protein
MKLSPNYRSFAGAVVAAATLFTWGIAKAQEEAPAAATPEAPAAEAPPAAETAPASEVAPAAETPASEVAPAAETPAPEATPAPAPVKKKKVVKAKKKEAEKSARDTEPPGKEPPGPVEALLIEKLSLGVGFGLGGVVDKEFSSDLMSYYFLASYKIQPLPILERATLVGAVQYHTYTGVVTEKDRSYDVQSYLIGAGANYDVPGLEKLVAQVIPYVGFSRTVNWEMVKYTFGEPEYGFAAAVDARASYSILEDVSFFAGAGFKLQPRVWTELQIGAQGTF